MIRRLPPPVRRAMIASARAAIELSLSRGSPLGMRVPRTEPGLVAAVTSFAVPQMARDWRRFLDPIGARFEMSAVFTHQAPKVGFTSASKRTAICELADLLIVVDDLDTGRRQASLIQAKMAAQRGTVKISRPQDKLQLELFQNWPHFSFQEPIYNLVGVDFHLGGAANQCGQFGVIDRHLVTPPIWYQMPPSAVPGKTRTASTLANFIVDLVDGKVGRDATPALASDWSTTVEALMTVTFGRMFHQRQSLGPLALPRGNSTQAYLLQGNPIQISISTDGSLPVDAVPETTLLDEEPPYRALSIIRIGMGARQP